MTVSTSTTKTSGTAGTGAAQIISFTFPVMAAADVKAIKVLASTGVATALVKDTDYTVSLTGSGTPNYTGGSITTLTPFIASTYNIYVYRDTTATQAYNPVNNDDMDAEDLEQAFDKLFMMIAELKDQIARCIQIPRPEATTVELPSYINRASETAQFDADGDVTTA